MERWERLTRRPRTCLAHSAIRNSNVVWDRRAAEPTTMIAPRRASRYSCDVGRRDMNIAIPLERMSATEKLQAIDEIWSDLARVSEDVPSPSWHADVLRAREQRIADGTSRFLDIDEAKQAGRERIT